jgi:hypothetical protein
LIAPLVVEAQSAPFVKSIDPLLIRFPAIVTEWIALNIPAFQEQPEPIVTFLLKRRDLFVASPPTLKVRVPVLVLLTLKFPFTVKFEFKTSVFAVAEVFKISRLL